MEVVYAAETVFDLDLGPDTASNKSDICDRKIAAEKDELEAGNSGLPPSPGVEVDSDPVFSPPPTTPAPLSTPAPLPSSSPAPLPSSSSTKPPNNASSPSLNASSSAHRTTSPSNLNSLDLSLASDFNELLLCSPTQIPSPSTPGGSYLAARARSNHPSSPVNQTSPTTPHSPMTPHSFSSIPDSVPEEDGLGALPEISGSVPIKRGASSSSTGAASSTTPSSLTGTTPITELDEDVKLKILEQVEFYFSDANVTKDKELAKQIRRNEMGYVSIKWITSFRKIQALTTDWKAVSRVLIQSTQLKVSTDKKMVRRKQPIPRKSDQFADRTVMATSLNLDERTVDAVKDFFSPYGKVTLVRFLNEAKPLPDDIAALGLAMWRGPPDIDTVAVEFETSEAAEKAVVKLADNWRSSAQVVLLRPRHRASEPVAGSARVPAHKTRRCSENVTSSSPRESYVRQDSEKFARKDSYSRSDSFSKPRSISEHPPPGTSPGTSPHGAAAAVRRSVDKSPHRAGRPSRGASLSESLSPSANSYLGQRMAMEKHNNPVAHSMVLLRAPKGPDGSRGFGHRAN